MGLVMWMRSQWDRLLAGALLAAGIVVLFAGWRGVSGTAYPAEQLPFLISAGLGGLYLLGVSTALWLSADLRDEWRKLDRIEKAIGALAAGSGDRSGALAGAPAAQDSEPAAQDSERGGTPLQLSLKGGA